METGSLGMKYDDRTNPLDKVFLESYEITKSVSKAPFAAQIFGNAALEHGKKYGSTAEHLCKIAHKNHKHSVNNPYAQFKKEYTLD
jgi:sterol carrier protein 2